MTTIGRTIEEITNAEFPRDVPADLEDNFLVVVCEPDSLQWSFHEGVNYKYSPVVFWTTPYLQSEDVVATPCLTLHRFLPHHALIHIFGGNEMKLATKQNASRVAARRKVPFTTVYILSNFKGQESGVVQLFQDIPARLFRLRPSDFFTQQQRGDLSESMISAGQFASMYAAKTDYGLPLLLLKGGSAITYMGMDSDSKIIGGGACPGMSIRCRALFDYCNKDFPSIDFLRYKQLVHNAKRDEKPMSLFAYDMEVGIAANATAELAGQLRNIVKQFLKLVGPSDKPATVVVTGDDKEILMQLLKENCSAMIETEPDVAFPPSSKVIFSSMKNMAPYGVKHLLKKKKNKKKEPDSDLDEEMRDDLIGLRVATSKEAKKTVLRGSITKVFPGKMLEEDTFVVLLDDGEEVFLDLITLYDAMVLYREVGEETIEETSEDWVEEKREASAKVQVNLEEKIGSIKKRKIKVDAAKAKEGSLEKAVVSDEQPRGKKRKRLTPKRKDNDPNKYIGQRVAKYFDEEIYFGTLDGYDEKAKLWHVTYDDDDAEDFDLQELREAVLLYAKQKGKDTNADGG